MGNMKQGGVSVGNMKQGGVSVGMTSHKCGKYETGWGKCGKKKGRVRMKSVRVVTLPPY